jgi:WhiB family redox-sensing transcriptional regulator
VPSVSTYLKPIHSNWEWQEEGVCRSFETNTFFLENSLRGKKKSQKEKIAVSICNTCPVKMQCLEHALNTPEIYGVWGGMTEEQRHQILRKRGIKFEYIRV